MKTIIPGALLLTLAALQPIGARCAEPPSFDAAAAWTRYLAEGTFRETNAAYDTLARVGYDGTQVQPDRCRTAATDLDDAVRRVPVGLAVRHAKMLCAEATGDAARADSELAVVAALVRDAHARSGTGAWAPPLRVVRPEDVDAFVAASGYERRYAFYNDLHPARYFPLTVALFDGERRTERLVAFDFVDTLVQLKADRPFHGKPFDRYAMAVDFVDAWAGGGDVAAVDARAVRDAWAEPDLPRRRDLLKAGAGRGGLMAARGWLTLCRAHPFAGCAEGLADALLPLAEAGQGTARVTLAMAYLDGIGVRRDDAAARALIESSDRTWADRGASVDLALDLVSRDSPWPAWLAPRLQDPAVAEAPGARAALVLSHAGKATPLTAAERAFLEAPAQNRRGRGLALLASIAEERKAPEAVALRERAAAAGDATAQRVVAVQMINRDGDAAAAQALLRDAAASGDSAAAWLVALDEQRAGHLKAARDWLFPGAIAGDIDSQLALAGVLETGAEGLDSGPAQARGMYEELASDSAEAREQLAGMLLLGRGGAKDPARARALLEKDAAAGEVGAQTALASAFAHGLFGKADPASARKWFDRAVAKGDAAARTEYGTWLVRDRTSKARAEGLALLRQAAASDSLLARNNLAWAQCTSQYDDVRDGKAGLEVARAMGDLAKLDAGRIDTVAACHAAAGDYPEAARVQAVAIAATPDAPLYAAMRQSLAERLELYRSGKAYTETQPDE